MSEISESLGAAMSSEIQEAGLTLGPDVVDLGAIKQAIHVLIGVAILAEVKSIIGK